MAVPCSKNVKDIYLNVVLDVINGVREAFLDEGMDEQVLQELRQLWESKLVVSKALEPEQHQDSQPNVIELPQQPAAQPMQLSIPQHMLRAAPAHIQPQQQQQLIGQPQTLQHGQMVVHQRNMTLAAQTAQFALPAGLFQQYTQQQLQQQQLTQQLQLNQLGISVQPQFTVVASGTQQQQQQQAQTDSKTKPLIQLDGLGDSSSDEDIDNQDDDDDDDNDDDVNDDGEEAEAEEENPLNSDDDVSDSDPTEVFDAENVIVCQFDKINRSKNKWKFHLKDGIMNLNGKDQLFQKANGDAEW